MFLHFAMQAYKINTHFDNTVFVIISVNIFGIREKPIKSFCFVMFVLRIISLKVFLLARMDNN